MYFIFDNAILSYLYIDRICKPVHTKDIVSIHYMYVMCLFVCIYIYMRMYIHIIISIYYAVHLSDDLWIQLVFVCGSGNAEICEVVNDSRS